MRSLFIVVSKVYGLMQAYTGLTYIFALLPMLHMLRQHWGPADAETTMQTTFHGEVIPLSAFSLGVMVVLTFGIAWLLIFRTEWLADKLRLSEMDAMPAFPVQRIIYAGTKLIGLLMVVQGIPLLTHALFHIQHARPFGVWMWSNIAPPLVRLAIGGVLLRKTDWIVGLILGREGENQSVEAKS